MRILLTGFEPFNNGKLNPSEQIVRTLTEEVLAGNLIAGVDLHTAILPVVFTESAELLKHLLAKHQPDAVICLGQAEGRKEISFERVAVNIDDARIADNAGRTITDQPIIFGAPDAHFTTLPVKELVDAVHAEGVAAGLSLSAGTFVCNHIFYNLQHSLLGTNVPSGFVHVPLQDEQAGDFDGQPTMPLGDQVRGIRAAIAALARVSLR
ncbi:MAG: pyroglutamyl-peptidase I [Micrococcales bacterium]